MTDEDTLRSLKTRLTDQRHIIRKHDGYYEGALRLAALGISLPPEMRQLQTVVNWPRLTVDALEERIDLQGFRMFEADDVDDRLWGWWQSNDLDAEASLGHIEAFVQGRAYVTVGYNEDNPQTPIITCESARNMIADVDPRTRKVKAVLRLYDQDTAGEARSATLYLPNETLYFVSDRGRWHVQPTETVAHGWGRVPVVPFVNKARLHDRIGTSEMADVMGLTDAACRNLTNLQGGQELMALPTRYVFGITDADMRDQEGNAVTKWEAYLGRFNALADDEAKVVQLPAAELRNFADTTDHYAKLVASVTGMPPHYLGLSSDNPASADAIRSGEARHVKRAERKIKGMVSGTWEEVMRLGLLVVDGAIPEEAKRMEAQFGDPATPTYAAKVDGVVKLHGAGLLPDEAAWEDLGYSPTRRRRLAELKAADPMNRLAASVGVPGSAPAAVGATGAQGADAGLLNRLGNSSTDGATP